MHDPAQGRSVPLDHDQGGIRLDDVRMDPSVVLLTRIPQQALEIPRIRRVTAWVVRELLKIFGS